MNMEGKVESNNQMSWIYVCLRSDSPRANAGLHTFSSYLLFLDYLLTIEALQHAFGQEPRAESTEFGHT